ncbi:MarR family winged helix-turn-helix transcriptional regulator [Ochrobactrum sp. RH2CCR150]|uniref:MarR family winged helix-turn-helix transcriptional regulator n=1 Tax=Ochrobactrum sp. RH2CCR150 TaxID=2587044 RepID=UPI0015FBD989|nr:MarR family transcriptional regulator for hemolysin [Ochrobactrum sp. RH2CCR150]
MDSFDAKNISLRNLAANILFSGTVLRSLEKQAFSEIGLDPTVASCLFWIAQVGDGARQIDIATQIGMTAPSLVRIIDLLEELQLVHRAVDETNRRANRIWLTAEGERMVVRMRTILDSIHQSLFDEFDAREIEAANHFLQKLIDKVV